MCHRFRSDDNSTGMNSELTDRSFHLDSSIDDFPIFIFIFIGFLEFYRFFESFFELYSWTSRDELRKVIHLLEGDTEGTTRILYSRACGQSTKCTHLSNMVSSVFLTHIREDFFTTSIREVDIDIRHRDTRRIQESFKEESISEWINIGDS